MKVEIENIGGLKRRVKVVVPAERVAREVDKAYHDLRKSVRVKGFRPGKAPRFILERYYGQQVKEHVMSQLIEETLEEVIRDNGLDAVGGVEVEERKMELGQEMYYVAVVEVMPEIQVEGYEGLEIPEQEVKVTEEKIDKRIEEIRELFARVADVEEERPVQEGDLVLCKMRTLVDGEPLGPKEGEERLLEIKEGEEDERLHKSLIGKRPGETLEIPRRFPDDYKVASLAGKEGKLEVKVISIKRKILPELNDEFAKRLGEYENLEALRAGVRRELEEEERRRLEERTRKRLMEQLLEKYDFEVPESLVAEELEAIMNSVRRKMAVYGIDRGDAQGFVEQMRESYREEARKNVRSSLILRAIAQKEKLEVTESHLRKAMATIARETGRDLSEVERIYSSREEALERLKESVLEELALDFLRQKAKMVASAA